jgi:hypothetical protein
MEEKKRFFFDTTSTRSTFSNVSNMKLSRLAYKYHRCNVLKDKYLFLFGYVPQQFINEVEKIKDRILKIEPNYFDECDKKLSVSSRTLSESQFDSITNDSIIDYLKKSSTPVKFINKKPLSSKLSISTFEEKSTVTKTVTFTSKIRDFYQELREKEMKKENNRLIKNDLIIENKRFLSPRDHYNTKIQQNTHQTCLSCNKKMNNYKFNQTVTSPASLPLAINFMKKKSFFSKLSFFNSCVRSSMTYEDFLMNQ